MNGRFNYDLGNPDGLLEPKVYVSSIFRNVAILLLYQIAGDPRDVLDSFLMLCL